MDDPTPLFEKMGVERVKLMLQTGTLVWHFVLPAHEWLASKQAFGEVPEAPVSRETPTIAEPDTQAHPDPEPPEGHESEHEE